jgi:GTP-binding protein
LIPVVAIVGRPNTGKSTLFNVLSGKKISIVDEIAGVTRDRVTFLMTWKDRTFELMDTGGIGMVDVADIAVHVERQIEAALHLADIIVFLTDVRDGVLPLDRRVAGELRKLGRPVILAANKAETVALETAALDFHVFGFGEPIAISAQNRVNTTVLLDAIVAALPERTAPEDTESGPLVAIVGRRNSGKSTFLNSVAGHERVIVSEQPGTTRDSVDVRVRVGDRTITLIDTAGVQRRTSAAGTLDYLAQHRTERSLRRANAVLLLLDATEEVGELDKKLADRSLEHGKPTVLVVNKWDLARERATLAHYEEYLRDRLPMLSFSPLVFVCAKTGEQVLASLELAEDLIRQARERAGTGELNRVLRETLEIRSPRIKSRVAKIFYGSQVGVEPPEFLLFVNDPKLFDPAYRRFIEGRLRHAFPFPEVPIRLRFRSRKSK